MQQAIAITQASAMFTWCSPASTGMIVADRPMTPAKDRSNSPTTNVHSAAIDRNSSGDWEPKMACAVLIRRKLCGVTKP